MTHSFYETEYQNNHATRIENDRLLLPVLESIQGGSNIEALERFAKAYLGLFFDVDKRVTPFERIHVIANPQLAQAILAGLNNFITHTRLPDFTQIADSLVDEKPLAEGHILLAALDILVDQDSEKILSLPVHTLQTAVCFHYANQTEIQDRWLQQLLEHDQTIVADVLGVFWLQMIRRGTDYLPGLSQILQQPHLSEIAAQTVITVLQHWRKCRKKTLRTLLHKAWQLADKNKLLQVTQTALQQWNRNEPGRYVLWLATAFLLQPQSHAMLLAEYVGRSKEKIIPLLDFMVLVLQTDNAANRYLDAQAYAQLLQVIAPKITPQYDCYENLCDNTPKVMYLFYCLAVSDDASAVATIQKLCQVRVMKLYMDILNLALEIQADAESKKIAWPDFLARLQSEGRIKARKRWSDLDHKKP